MVFQNGSLLKTCVGHEDEVRGVAISPDGTTVVSGGRDRTIRVWKADSGEELQRLMADDNEGVISLAFAPDGVHFVSGGYDGSLRLWKCGMAAPVQRMPIGCMVLRVMFCADGKRVFVCCFDGSVRAFQCEPACSQ